MTDGNPTETRVSPLRIALFLFAIAGILLAAHLVAQAAEEAFGAHLPERATRMWFLDDENNIPTWFSSLLLALVGGGLAIIGVLKYQERDPHHWQWFALAFVTLALSLDEMAQIHEALTEPLSDRFGLGGPLFYAWIVAAAPIVGVLTLLFLPFLRRLPRRTVVLLLAGAGTTFAGGMIVEMGEGWWVDAHGQGGVVLLAIVTLQEMLEMTGAIIAFFAVMDYVAGYRSSVLVHVEREELPLAEGPGGVLREDAGLRWEPAERP